MKKTLALLALALSLGLTGFDAEAGKRLGGGKSTGMQRQNVTEQARSPGATPGTPAQQAAPNAAAAAAPAAAAAAQKRSWMGPLAGLAAGLGLAALASHLGFGEAFANMLLIGLAVMAVLVVVGLIMRKRAAAQGMGSAPAAAAAGAGMSPPMDAPAPNGMARESLGGSRIGSRLGGASGLAPAAAVGRIPADFDAEAFARNAKTQFMALQSANDAGDVSRLRDLLSPEMYTQVAQDLRERGAGTQTTEVFGLEARVLDVSEEPAQYIVSVRFTGSTRTEAGVAPDDLDEVWHLSKPRQGMGGWVVAGIEQV